MGAGGGGARGGGVYTVGGGGVHCRGGGSGLVVYLHPEPLLSRLLYVARFGNEIHARRVACAS